MAIFVADLRLDEFQFGTFYVMAIRSLCRSDLPFWIHESFCNFNSNLLAKKKDSCFQCCMPIDSYLKVKKRIICKLDC